MRSIISKAETIRKSQNTVENVKNKRPRINDKTINYVTMPLSEYERLKKMAARSCRDADTPPAKSERIKNKADKTSSCELCGERHVIGNHPELGQICADCHAVTQGGYEPNHRQSISVKAYAGNATAPACFDSRGASLPNCIPRPAKSERIKNKADKTSPCELCGERHVIGNHPELGQICADCHAVTQGGYEPNHRQSFSVKAYAGNATAPACFDSRGASLPNCIPRASLLQQTSTDTRPSDRCDVCHDGLTE